MIISAGNDIVDLKLIDAERTQSPGFYTKIITGTEKELYDRHPLAAMPFAHFVWLLWSVKESVYKFIQRAVPDLVFSPSKIIIGQIDTLQGNLITGDKLTTLEHIGFDGMDTINTVIIFKGDVYYTKSIITPQYIVTVANNNPHFKDIYWGVTAIEQTDPDYQSAAVRTFILKKLAAVLNNHDLSIVKNFVGCPVLFNGDEETNTPVSLAHHGNYAAYTFPLVTG